MEIVYFDCLEFIHSWSEAGVTDFEFLIMCVSFVYVCVCVCVTMKKRCQTNGKHDK